MKKTCSVVRPQVASLAGGYTTLPSPPLPAATICLEKISQLETLEFRSQGSSRARAPPRNDETNKSGMPIRRFATWVAAALPCSGRLH